MLQISQGVIMRQSNKLSREDPEALPVGTVHLCKAKDRRCNMFDGGATLVIHQHVHNTLHRVFWLVLKWGWFQPKEFSFICFLCGRLAASRKADVPTSNQKTCKLQKDPPSRWERLQGDLGFAAWGSMAPRCLPWNFWRWEGSKLRTGERFLLQTLAE